MAMSLSLKMTDIFHEKVTEVHQDDIRKYEELEKSILFLVISGHLAHLFLARHFYSPNNELVTLFYKLFMRRHHYFPF